MKIAFAIDDTLDVSDGVQQAVITIGENMRSMGHEVHYLCSDTKRKDLGGIHSLAKTFRVAFNGNFMRIPRPASRKKIKALLEEENFDVIHVQMPYSPLFVEKIILCAPKHTKIFGTFHILPYKNINKFAASVLGRIVKKSLKSIDQVISVSEPARDFCKSVFKVESVVVPNPVDIKKYTVRDTVKYSKRRIVFLGRLVERKGAKELLAAYKELLISNPELITTTALIIAGKGEQEKLLKKIAKEFPKEAEIQFLGFINEEDKPILLNSADIAVFPSKAGESFGIVLIEAMAAGSRLILAGDNPGYRSVLQNFPELLVDPKNKKEFALALGRLLEVNNTNFTISSKLKNHVKQYDVKKVCETLIKLYSS